MANRKPAKVWISASKKKPSVTAVKTASKGTKVSSKEGKFVVKEAKSKASIKTEPKKKAFPGFARNNSGIFVPDDYVKIVPASKLRQGFIKAKKEIEQIVKDIITTMTDDYGITEIELNASFNADGKFMGFGVGGAASIKIKIAPR
jgi:hypothetical protein